MEAPNEMTFDDVFVDGTFSSERFVLAKLKAERRDLADRVKSGELTLAKAMGLAWGCGCNGD